ICLFFCGYFVALRYHPSGACTKCVLIGPADLGPKGHPATVGTKFRLPAPAGGAAKSGAAPAALIDAPVGAKRVPHHRPVLHLRRGGCGGKGQAVTRYPWW